MEHIPRPIIVKDRRATVVDVGKKYLSIVASIFSILAFVGLVFFAIAKQSEADVNAKQDSNIAVLQSQTNSLQEQITEERQDIKNSNDETQLKIDALLHALGLDPASIIAKSLK